MKEKNKYHKVWKDVIKLLKQWEKEEIPIQVMASALVAAYGNLVSTAEIPLKQKIDHIDQHMENLKNHVISHEEPQ